MTLRVGVIGVGNIGTAHSLNLARYVSGATVAAVFDADMDRAAHVASEVGAVAMASYEALIEDPGVDAVVVSSPDNSHAEQAMACIAAGKFVLCEKPLAPDPADALAIMAAEAALGRRLITVGFMRRFDPGYVELRRRLRAGDVGVPLIVRNIHRNQGVLPTQTTAMSLTNSAVHEIDINRWLLGCEYSSVRVMSGLSGPRSGRDLQDPLLVFLQTTSGPIVEIELFVNATFGYEVRCEVVASNGTLLMGDGALITESQGGQRRRPVHPQWLGRFEDAYRLEMQSWVDSISSGVPAGPSAWDGYVATVVAGACAEAAENGDERQVELTHKAELY